MAGGPIRGSWWGHPAGKAIFDAATALAASREALATRLVAGKVTFVHRALWPALVRIATDPGRRVRARRGLPPLARRLLAEVERAGRIRLDEVASRWGLRAADRRRSLSAARRVLEERLLVQGEEVHTERGSHSVTLLSWETWAGAALLRRARGLSLGPACAKLRRASSGVLAV